MRLNGILACLNGPAPEGIDAETFARMAFLEWAAEHSQDNVHLAARSALIRMHALVANAPAIARFRDLLTQAVPSASPPRRRGGRRRRAERAH